MRNYATLQRATTSFLIMMMAVLSFSVLSCKKGTQPAPAETEQKEEETTPPDKPATSDALLSTAEAVPGQIIECTFGNSSVTKDTLHALLSGTPMVLYRTDEGRYTGIVPVVPAGAYTLGMTAVVLTQPLRLTVSPYTPVSQPETILAPAFDRLSAAIGEVKALPETEGKAETAYLDQLMTEIQGILSGLSEAEKTELAYLIVANKPEQLLTPANGRQAGAVRLLAVSNPVNQLVDEALKLNAAVAAAAISGTATAISVRMMFKKPHPYLAAFTGLSIGTFAVSVHYALHQAEKVGKLPGIAAAILGFEERTRRTRALLTSEATDPRWTFTKNEPRQLGITMTFRTVSREDATHTGAAIRQILEDDVKLADISGKVKALLAPVASYLPAAGKFAAYVSPFPAVATPEIGDTPLEHISIADVSDPAIRLSYVAEGDQLQVTATSETLHAERDFTFDVIYRHEGLGVTVRKTIDATFDGRMFPHRVAIAGGNDQQGTAGQRLADALKVKVTDANGQPLQGAEVHWKVNSGGGSLSAATSLTDAGGMAEVFWTIGSSGSQEAEAVVTGKDGVPVQGSPAVFKTLSAGLIVGEWSIISSTIQVNSGPTEPFDSGTGSLLIRENGSWRSDIGSDGDEENVSWGTYTFHAASQQFTIRLFGGDTVTYRVKTLTPTTLSLVETENAGGHVYLYTQTFRRVN